MYQIVNTCEGWIARGSHESQPVLGPFRSALDASAYLEHLEHEAREVDRFDQAQRDRDAGLASEIDAWEQERADEAYDRLAWL